MNLYIVAHEEYCIIDEMLESYRGKCKFCQYIVNKPNKYGVKIFALIDSCVFYTINMEMYAAKQPIKPFLQNNIGASQPYDKTNC